MSERSGSPFSDRNMPSKKKKINKPKFEEREKISEHDGQSKITFFFKNVQKKQKNRSPTHKTLVSLQSQLQHLKQQQDKLISQKESLIQQQNEKKNDYEQWVKKSKCLIQQSICQIYSNVRQRKSQINPEIGFFSNQNRIFIKGIIGQQSEIKKIKLEQVWNEKQENQEKEIIFDFLQQENFKLQFYRKEIQHYKEKLRIATEERTCKFADSWPLLAGRFQVLELIGKGGFSEVYKAYDLDQNKFVAVKMSSSVNLKDSLAHYIVRQYENHITLQHENIAKLYQVIQVSSTNVCIALQYCQGPELSTYLKDHKKISERIATYIFKQILQALSYLSSLNPKIIHYDLKPQNIIFHQGKIKIVDFGLSKQIDNQHSKIALSNQGIGTYWYLPPETFHEKNPQISEKVDIWSAGVIFYQMLCGRKPFGHNKSQSSVYNEGIILQAGEVEFPEQVRISERAKYLIRKCLSYNPEKRLSPKQALWVLKDKEKAGQIF